MVGASLTVELLDRVRQYITPSRLLEYNLTEPVMKAVQDDFVGMRQGEQGMTGELPQSSEVLTELFV